jgi:hypothetical protein
MLRLWLKNNSGVCVRDFDADPRGELAFCETMVAQQTLIGLTDNLGQVREPPLSGISGRHGGSASSTATG